MNTDGMFTQNTPVTDGHIFIGPSEWQSTTAINTLFGTSGEGNVYLLLPAGGTVNLFTSLEAILRSGMYALFGDRAFGTKGPPPVPGPSIVSGTSGPRGITSKPPITKTQMPTLVGPAREPVPKGIRVQAVDVIGTVLNTPLTSISFGLTSTAFSASGAVPAAPVVTNIIPYGNNGLPIAVATNPGTATIQVPTPTFIIPTTPTTVIAHLGVVTPAGSTFVFYGINLRVSYNYN